MAGATNKTKGSRPEPGGDAAMAVVGIVVGAVGLMWLMRRGFGPVITPR